MNITEKKAIVDNILDLLIKLTEDGDNSAPQTTKHRLPTRLRC